MTFEMYARVTPKPGTKYAGNTGTVFYSDAQVTTVGFTGLGGFGGWLTIPFATAVLVRDIDRSHLDVIRAFVKAAGNARRDGRTDQAAFLLYWAGVNRRKAMRTKCWH